MKTNLIDVKTSSWIYFEVKSNDKDPNWKILVDDRVKISKYKNVFAKDYTPNWPENVLVIKKAKHSVLWAYVICP